MTSRWYFPILASLATASRTLGPTEHTACTRTCMGSVSWMDPITSDRGEQPLSRAALNVASDPPSLPRRGLGEVRLRALIRIKLMHRILHADCNPLAAGLRRRRLESPIGLHADA